MELKTGIKTFYPRKRTAWRCWLEKNGTASTSVWLILYKKATGKKSITYAEAVEEALCFGWIDSKPNKRDGESWYQFFSKRKPSSGWSKINKDRVKSLIAEGLMTAAGLVVIKEAKKNGSWSALDSVEKLEIPADLKAALDKNKRAAGYFEAFPSSVRKGILDWIRSAKTEPTRTNRIIETVTLAGTNIRANQYKPKTS